MSSPFLYFVPSDECTGTCVCQCAKEPELTWDEHQTIANVHAHESAGLVTRDRPFRETAISGTREYTSPLILDHTKYDNP